jgi:hypothetical protein
MHVRILIVNYKVDFVATTHVMQKCTYNSIGIVNYARSHMKDPYV